jgi:hypothetical protein
MPFGSAVKPMPEPILQREDAPVFLAIADSFCAQTTQRWARRFDRESWRRFVRQTEDMLQRFEVIGMDDFALFAPPSASEHATFVSCHFTPEKTWSVIPRERFYRQNGRGSQSGAGRWGVWGSVGCDDPGCNDGLRGGGVWDSGGARSYADGAARDCAAIRGGASSAGSYADGGGTLSFVVSTTDGAQVANVVGMANAAATVNDGPAWASEDGEVLYLGNSRRETLLAGVNAHFAQSLNESADHLSVMLTFLAFLMQNNMLKEAHQYLYEHFEWLPEYRSTLLRVAPCAWFYALLLDLVIRIKSAPIQGFYGSYCCQLESRN